MAVSSLRSSLAAAILPGQSPITHRPTADSKGKCSYAALATFNKSLKPELKDLTRRPKRRFQMKKALNLLAVLVFTCAFASLAQAQATRTWVSGVSDDVNPCSRTAPCKTYAGAISKTATGGEISTLDPGGFGAVTITKSIMIEGTKGQGYGSILASSVNGILINDAASAAPNTAIVTLRNLSINGAGTTKGTNGVRFIAGKALHVEDCQITNFGTG